MVTTPIPASRDARRPLWISTAALALVAATLFTAGALAPSAVRAASTVPVVSTGVDFTCSLTPAGPVFCSGRNIEGELGQGKPNTAANTVPVMVKNLPPATRVSAGQFQACAIDQGAVLRCWGDNAWGQLGDGSLLSSARPVKVLGGLHFADVSAGGTFTCAISTSGAVYCWGKNDHGQLGDGTIAASETPVKVMGLRLPALQIAAGADRHACVLLNDGSVACWGANDHGQLGNGTTTESHLPVAVAGLTGGITAITGAGGHTCVLGGGHVLCWGHNQHGQIGDGTTTDRTVPTPVAGLAGLPSMVSAGGYHTCALVAGSATTVECWGQGTYGQLGDGMETGHDALVPQQVFGLTASAAGGPGGAVQVAAGGGHTCAVISSGQVECWGQNQFGQVGDGTAINRGTPSYVLGLTTGPQAISEAGSLGCALTQGLGVACWGSAAGNDFNAHTAAVAVAALPAGVGRLATGSAGCALATAGSLQCWGPNTFGEVGDGSTTARPTPVNVSQFSGGTGLAGDVSAGLDTCALSRLNVAYCWGANPDGVLGDGNTNDSAVPQAVRNIGHVAQIAAGLGTSCAVATNDKAYCWGDGDYGEVGNGGTSDTSLPMGVTGLPGNRAVQIASGGSFVGGPDFGDFTCAVVLAGDVYCWGYDSSGQLGDGAPPDTLPHASPGKVSLPQPARAVVTGAFHSCALLDDGSVWCWGANGVGELGNGGSPSFSSSPVAVSGLSSGVLAISASGDDSTCALLASPAQVRCWGNNTADELGDGVSGGFATTPQVVQGL